MTFLRKIYDEGTQSPFVSRLILWPLMVRDFYIQQELLDEGINCKLQKFDNNYQPVWQALTNQREAAKRIIELLRDHNFYLANMQMSANVGQITIEREIDNPLNKEIKSFIVEGNIALKSGLQNFLIEVFNLNIGYIFQKETLFKNGLSSLREGNENSLIDYLSLIRTKWLYSFVSLRNDIEHNGYKIPLIKYTIQYNNAIKPEYPNILDMSIERFVREYHNHVCLCVEDLLAYAFTRNLNLPVYLYEIPYISRNPSNCERFSIEPIGLSDKAVWGIKYSETSDFL